MIGACGAGVASIGELGMAGVATTARRRSRGRILRGSRGQTFGGAMLEIWRALARDLFDSYRPEKHYMRGPGPKWQARQAQHATATEPEFAAACGPA
jgi:hypothetical protein